MLGKRYDVGGVGPTDLSATPAEVVMKRYARLSIVVLLALAGASCGDSSAPTSLDVRATVSRAQYRAGDSVSVAVEIENTGEGALRIPGGFPAFLEVRNSAGKVVFFGRSGTFAMVGYPPRILEHGERVVDPPLWGSVVTGPSTVTAEPGSYRVRAAVMLVGKGDYVFSAPLDVTLVP